MESEEIILKPGDKVSILCCSNARPLKRKEETEHLGAILQNMGLCPVFSKLLYEREPHSVFGGTGRERAEALMEACRDTSVKAIFDISGGDIANEILRYADFTVVKDNPKPLFGYSDLTVLLNAVYVKTAQVSCLYQICNLLYDHGKEQRQAFLNSLFYGKKDLYDFTCHFIRGESMAGTVVGGNIRCLLKLAGTEFWPEMNGKILFLESYRGGVDRMVAYLSQLAMMGTFDRVSGVLLGTFSEMEKKGEIPPIEALVMELAGDTIPIARTEDIGHGTDSKCLILGKELELRRK